MEHFRNFTLYLPILDLNKHNCKLINSTEITRHHPNTFQSGFLLYFGIKVKQKLVVFSGPCVFVKVQVAKCVAKDQLVRSFKPCQLVPNIVLTIRFKESNLTTFCVADYRDFLASITCVFLSVLQPHCVKSVQIRSYFWPVFCCIRTEYGDLRSIPPVSIQENTDQK